ncbi:hypothetical protein [Mitsuaria sp. GD03876]|uniref:hypothetical protein n=1 Tax=Mitsuaria sp. GD03876 TaxID=2975399 RepID=UPI00244B59C0|nr:hypothetical protein [Mitsuaria sp. GD03876]MDH0863330.1 hypothetical protein [Mitsuaria sp. GD03876]
MSPRFVFLGISVLLYLLSLALPALRYAGGEPVSGLFILGFGWYNGTAHWLANPLMWGAWRLLAIRKPAFSLAVLVGAGFLMLSSLGIKDAVWGGESGIREPVAGLDIGFWIWFLSAVVAAIGAVAELAGSRKAGEGDEPH